MTPENIAKQIAADIAEGVRKSLKEIRSGFDRKLAEVETAFENRFAAMPAPEKGDPGEAGERGEKGDPGQDAIVDLDAIMTEVGKLLAALEPPKGDPGEKGEKGDKGDDGAPGAVDMEEVKGLLQEIVKGIELPKGEKGDPGEAGAPGAVDMEEVKALLSEAIAAIEIPKGEKGDPGQDAVIDMEKVWEIIVDEFKKVELPKPEKGEKGDPGIVDVDQIKQIVSEEIALAGGGTRKSILDEKIEDGINEEETYARGTLARHRGGIWRAFERTKGMRGWECLLAGVAGIYMDFDGERSLTITVEKSDGEPEIKNVKVPALLYRDMYQDGEQYEKNDCVTLSGALWIATQDTRERPGLSQHWKLAVKRGGTGKSAYDLAREAGFKGTRSEWLDQLGKKPIVKLT